MPRNVTFKAENPERISMTLTVTMTLEEWIEIGNFFTNAQQYVGLDTPTWGVRNFQEVIARIIKKGEQSFYEYLPTKPEKEDGNATD